MSHQSKVQKQNNPAPFQHLLQQWYRYLLAPIEAEIAKVQNLIIVPHRYLHYVPFQALHNGRCYLHETHQIRYLPNANLLSYYKKNQTNTTGHCLAVGYSNKGQLPHTVAEASLVADIMQGETLLEEAATLSAVKEKAPHCRVIHFATHGTFNSRNPLFSGLQLADGYLTTLDIFSLPLSASLVTLSACQTGQHVITNGDELLGLMRAFLYAGAATLILSLWPVEDDATKLFMALFYQKLANGYSKGAALRQTQRQFIHGGDNIPTAYAHPYYWSPFFLVGDGGTL